MTGWIRWTAPAAAVISLSTPTVAASTASTSCNTGSPMAARSEARAGSGSSSTRPSGSPLKVGADIRNISGATLSSMHVTEGVKRILDAYGHLR